ncbi:MAG: hypothetical protein WA294_06515 [Acidobacteriaceae bacterium]
MQRLRMNSVGLGQTFCPRLCRHAIRRLCWLAMGMRENFTDELAALADHFASL